MILTILTRYPSSFMKINPCFKGSITKPHITKTLLVPVQFGFAQKPKTSKNSQHSLTYTPIRPLKKNLTVLYAQTNFINRGMVLKRIPFWPYLSPFYAMLINNFLTSWSFVNIAIASVMFSAGFLVRLSTAERRQKQILKLESSNGMSKLYITVAKTILTDSIERDFPKSVEGIPDENLFTEDELKGKEYEPTEKDKSTLTEEEIQQKKDEFNILLFKKIMKDEQRKKKISRFELDSTKTAFKLSQQYDDQITDSQVKHPPVDIEIKAKDMFDVSYKFLIVRTQFLSIKLKQPIHFYIDLEQNGDPKYQDYLTALGANYKISLDKETK